MPRPLLAVIGPEQSGNSNSGFQCFDSMSQGGPKMELNCGAIMIGLRILIKRQSYIYVSDNDHLLLKGSGQILFTSQSLVMTSGNTIIGKNNEIIGNDNRVYSTLEEAEEKDSGIGCDIEKIRIFYQAHVLFDTSPSHGTKRTRSSLQLPKKATKKQKNNASKSKTRNTR